MNWKYHLIFGILVFSLIVYFLRISLLSLEVIPMFVAVVMFSLLPDIDHEGSKVSKLFRVFYISSGFYSGYRFFIGDKSYLIAFVLSFLLFVFHFFIAKNSPRHRRFPHTFTFGIIASIILGIFTNFMIGIIGFIAFFIHLVLDKYAIKALRKDIKMWKKIFGG